MKQAMLAIEVRQQHYQPVLSIRTRTDVTRLPDLIADSYSRIGAYLNELDIEPEGAPFIAYYNRDMNDLDVEMGFPVDDVIPGDRDMCPGEIEEGRMVTCMYVGPYEGMKEVYGEMHRYIEEKGLQTKGPAYETYYNSPEEVENPEELMTRIDLPVY
ncbi:GyrI-like domain-containing protein [Proteiniclasticum sp. C24MP]|uniref:GyrI-like domain-containing protein n=1 Tax=Proteiniclasticum sp. C24MP TaxID=3374101 RepID=UPI0037553EC4